MEKRAMPGAKPWTLLFPLARRMGSRVAGQVSWLPAHCARSTTFPPETAGSGFACSSNIFQAMVEARWPDTVARPHRFCTDFPILLNDEPPRDGYSIQLAKDSIAFL